MLFLLKKYKDVNRLRNGFTTQVITNVDIDQIVKRGENK